MKLSSPIASLSFVLALASLGCAPESGSAESDLTQHSDCDELCPDASDPNVHYVSEDPLQCAAATFQCEPQQTTFDDDCGCGCIGPAALSCPDPNDPAVHYISQDPLACAAALFECEAGQTRFDDACGCGCIGEAPSSCASPDDPDVVWYVGDASTCSVVTYSCEPGETSFEDACGCGCRLE